jgi:hypothetical protein
MGCYISRSKYNERDKRSLNPTKIINMFNVQRSRQIKVVLYSELKPSTTIIYRGGKRWHIIV